MAARTRSSSWLALVRALRGSHRTGSPGLGARLRAVPRLVGAVVRGDYGGTSRWRLVGLGVGLLYVLSPVDFIPEAVLGPLGLGDDAVVVAVLAGMLLADTEEYLDWERAQQVADAGEPPRRGRGQGSAGGSTGRTGHGRTHAGQPGRPDVVPGKVVR